MANGTLTGQCTPGSLLSLPPVLNDLHIPYFYMGLEVQIPDPRIEWQTLYWLSHLPSPSFICKNRQQCEENGWNPTVSTRDQEERPWVKDSLPWTWSWKQSLEINLPRETSKVSKVRDTAGKGCGAAGRGGEIETSLVVASLILNCQPKDESFTKAIINPRKTKESRGDK